MFSSSDVAELSELETKAAAPIVELEGPGTSTDDRATPDETFGPRFLLVVFVVCPLQLLIFQPFKQSFVQLSDDIFIW